MLKIKKGLKKKIKGKKDKGKEDLFDPEQLAKYKKELEEGRKSPLPTDPDDPDHTHHTTESHEEDEEWLKFKQLTGGVDDILKKASGDLDRIKESSYFQRKSAANQNFATDHDQCASSKAQLKAQQQQQQEQAQATPSKKGPRWVGFDSENPNEDTESESEPELSNLHSAQEAEAEVVAEPETEAEVSIPGIVDISEDEPLVLDDSLFDTSFVDAIASGEIKLAYIPDSPIEEEGDDPFDTSAVADVVKRIEEEEKKRKKQVNLGIAVEFLTRTSDKSPDSPQAVDNRKKPRPRPHNINLLGSFDEDTDTGIVNHTVPEVTAAERPKDLFDELLDSPPKDSSSPLLDKLELCSGTISLVSNRVKESPKEESLNLRELINEFDLINDSETLAAENEALVVDLVSTVDDEFDLEDEFAALAAESLHKEVPVTAGVKFAPPKPPPPRPAFPGSPAVQVETDPVDPENDPFDTTFVDKLPPGKSELKIIESEILGEFRGADDEDDDFDFNPRLGEPDISQATTAPELNQQDLFESTETDLCTVTTAVIQPVSTKDCQLVPITSDSEQDPFDTSSIDKLVPGKAELKLLEEELLTIESQSRPSVSPTIVKILTAEVKPSPLEDFDDFDPRKEEVNINVLVSTLQLDFISEPVDIISAKVLTPQDSKAVDDIDPFDTSIVTNAILPGKVELRLLESEFVSDPVDFAQTTADLERKFSDSDFDFDPRGGEPVRNLVKPDLNQQDIFETHIDLTVEKPLIPQLGPGEQLCIREFVDPFDTSGFIVKDLLPGKAELKILEGELLNSTVDVTPRRPLPQVVLVQPKKPPPPSRPPVPHIFETTDLQAGNDLVKPLTPVDIADIDGEQTQFEDPFDTSIANSVIPGKEEIKILEKELGVETGLKRTLSDPDFNPREAVHPSADLSYNPLIPEIQQSSANTSTAEEIDPFDTSLADSLLPGFTTSEKLPTTQTGGRENPFLSYSGSSYDYSEPVTTSIAQTNPFADFADTSSSSLEAFHSIGTSNGPFDMGWGNEPVECQQEEDMPDLMGSHLDEHMSLIDTHSSEAPAGRSASPARPPPPIVPQSTQDLLETVTGALEATSDSLLDRLRVTQPSPVPQAPSPSPSPRSPSPDLFMLGDDPPPPAPPSSANPLNPSPHQLDSIIDLFDSPQLPSQPKTSVEILGLYNNVAQPIRPAAVDLMMDDNSQSHHDQSQQHMQTMSPTILSPAVSTPESQKSHKPQEIMMPTMAPSPVTKTHEIMPPTMIPMQVDVLIPTAAAKPQEKGVPISTVPQPPKELPIYRPEESPVKVNVPSAKAQPPERPKPPPPPARSPVVETKQPLPSRPPPPVPPAPRISAQPHYPASAPAHPLPSHPPPHPHPPHHSSPSHTSPQRPAPPVHQIPTQTPQQIFDQQQSQDPFGVASLFGSDNSSNQVANSNSQDIFGAPPQIKTTAPSVGDEFDAFDAKFNSFSEPTVETAKETANYDPFGMPPAATSSGDSAWGGSAGTTDEGSLGFGSDEPFDNFLSMSEPPPVPQSTPAKIQKQDDSLDFEKEEPDLAIFIRPKANNEPELSFGLAPALAPPPKSPAISTGSAYSEDNTAFVPFLSSAHDTTYAEAAKMTQMSRTDSQETPQTPLFEEDQSQPLEDFPRIKYTGDGWEMQMRHPNKKKITGQRFWKKVFVRISQIEVPVVQIYNAKTDKDPFQEIPLQPCYSVSDIGAQQFDQYGKIFTVKLQYVFYKERPGVRPGQITKAERITNKLTQFAAYAIQGDYQGVKEFGSDLKKLGLPLEHAPQISQLVKLGTQSHEELKEFSMAIEEALFHMTVHRDRAITYKTEEVQVTLVDEYYVEQDIYGVVTRQIARVRLFFLSFLSGVAEVEMGVNDLRRQGKEIVGRHDIIPVATEEWIRIEDVEFSNCVQLEEFENTKTIKFKPPDACYIELMRFRVRPPKHRELPLQVKTVFIRTGQRVEIRCDVLVPGFTSRKLGQIPCEDVMIRFPIPECWIYMFRVEKHFRYGSVKSAHRRSGKVKGIERFLGAVEAVEHSLMEVTSGQAKYEHQHKAIVWRIARLPKEGQGAYTTHSFFCHITLQAHEEVPDNLSKHCYVEFTMPHTTISHTVCRSISVPTSDEPPEKCVRYLSRHEYLVEIEHTEGIAPATYNLAAAVPEEEKPVPPPVEAPAPVYTGNGTSAALEGKLESDSDFSDD